MSNSFIPINISIDYDIFVSLVYCSFIFGLFYCSSTMMAFMFFNLVFAISSLLGVFFYSNKRYATKYKTLSKLCKTLLMINLHLGFFIIIGISVFIK
jgi:hypothetical protein